MTTITNKQETFIKTDKNREQILKKYNNSCFHCNKVKNEEELDVYIIDVNKEPHTIIPLCKSCHISLLKQEELQYRQNRNIIVSKENEKEYKEAKQRFRNNLKNAYDDMNIMIRILHQDNPDWSIKRIIKQILIENEDIIGISERSIYNHLDAQNRALVDTRFQKKNSVLEELDANLHPNVIEDSSIADPEINDIVQEIQGKKEELIELTDEEKEEEAKKLLPEHIYNYAKEREINPDKMLMIANPRLVKHPQLQERLINDIVLKTNKEAEKEVKQMVMDLETGAIFKDGKSYIFNEYSREKIDLKGKVVKHPVLAYLDIMKSVHKLCEDLTGHKLEDGEFEYTENHFKYTKEFRQEILRNVNDKRSLIALNNQLVLIADYAEDFIAMIDEASKDMDNKPDLTE